MAYNFNLQSFIISVVIVGVTLVIGIYIADTIGDQMDIFRGQFNNLFRLRIYPRYTVLYSFAVKLLLRPFITLVLPRHHRTISREWFLYPIVEEDILEPDLF